jgi:hypothetical protein
VSQWSPLGAFDPHAPVNPKILAKARALRDALPIVPAGLLKRCYLHWTVAPLGMCFADYNGEARYENGEWVLTITHDPRDNAPGLNDNAPASHTWLRNTGALGVAITGMDGPDVNPHDFGSDPVTVMGLTHLCAAAAAFCARYGIDTLGTSTDAPYADEPNIMTHAEAGDHVGSPAQYDAYGPASTFERWDLLCFSAVPQGVHFTDASICGNALRAMVHAYKAAL